MQGPGEATPPGLSPREARGAGLEDVDLYFVLLTPPPPKPGPRDQGGGTRVSGRAPLEWLGAVKEGRNDSVGRGEAHELSLVGRGCGWIFRPGSPEGRKTAIRTYCIMLLGSGRISSASPGAGLGSLFWSS